MSDLEALLEAARHRKMSRAEREEQMVNFVWGSGNISPDYKRTREEVRRDLGLDPTFSKKDWLWRRRKKS